MPGLGRPGRRVAGAVLTVLALLAGVTGCSGSDDAPSPAASTTAGAVAESPGAGGADRPDGPPPMTVPATRSGPLTSDNLPSAPDLGRGWKAYADPGDPAEGYLGNGTPFRERDPRQVADSIVPLGCPGGQNAPRPAVPDHALEGTYRGPDDAPAVALVLEYENPAAARQALSALQQRVRGCTSPKAGEPVAPGRFVAAVHRADDTALVDVRTVVSDEGKGRRWLEVVVRSGDRLGFTIVQLSAAGVDPNPAQLVRTLTQLIPR